MRIITKEIEAYTFDELSDNAKWNVVSWLNECLYDWGDEAFESLKEFKRWFDIDVEVNYDRRYWHTTPSTNYSNEDAWNLKGNRLRTWLVNNFADSLFLQRKAYSKRGYAYPGMKEKHRCSHIASREHYCPLTGVCYDESLLHPIRKFIAKPRDIDMYDLIEECLDSFVEDIQSEEDYHHSIEFAQEECDANEYEFTANGKVI